jgi:hypothetical protein
MIKDYPGDLWRIVSHFIRLSRCMCWKIFNFPLSDNMYVKNVWVAGGSAFVALNFIKLFKIFCFSPVAFIYKGFTLGRRQVAVFFLVKLSSFFVNWFYCYWTCCYFPQVFPKKITIWEGRSYPLSDFQWMTNKHISERLNLLRNVGLYLQKSVA